MTGSLISQKTPKTILEYRNHHVLFLVVKIWILTGTIWWYVGGFQWTSYISMSFEGIKVVETENESCSSPHNFVSSFIFGNCGLKMDVVMI